MVGRLNRRQNWLIVLALLAAWTIPHAVAAQGANGMAQGVVKDDKGNPVEGATVTFLSTQSGRKIETKTNKKGEYFQIGLAPGNYTITATTATLASLPLQSRINASKTLTTDLVVADKKAVEAAAAAASAAPGSAEAKANTARAAFTTAFDAGVAASNANRPDEAVEKFTQAAELNAACQDCYNNIGYVYFQKKDYPKAEAAYLKANEIKPNQAAYSGLASVYTAQKKLDQAQAAMSKATELSAASGGGGDADALFNQGVTLWNSGKIEEAKKQFQAAVNANPNHAEAHYQLGMALVNEGNMAGAASEWNTYLKLAPSGSHAAEVKAMLPSLK